MTTTIAIPAPEGATPSAPPDQARRLGRLAGLLYLIVLVAGAPPELLVRVPIASEDGVAATADAIRDRADLFRLAAFSDVVNIVAFLGVALVLYGLLRRVHAGAARAMLTFNTVSVAIMAANTVNHLASWWFATSSDLATSLGPDTADGLAVTSSSCTGSGSPSPRSSSGCGCSRSAGCCGAPVPCPAPSPGC